MYLIWIIIWLFNNWFDISKSVSKYLLQTTLKIESQNITIFTLTFEKTCTCIMIFFCFLACALISGCPVYSSARYNGQCYFLGSSMMTWLDAKVHTTSKPMYCIQENIRPRNFNLCTKNLNAFFLEVWNCLTLSKLQ